MQPKAVKLETNSHQNSHWLFRRIKVRTCFRAQFHERDCIDSMAVLVAVFGFSGGGSHSALAPDSSSKRIEAPETLVRPAFEHRRYETRLTRD